MTQNIILEQNFRREIRLEFIVALRPLHACIQINKHREGQTRTPLNY